MNRPKIAIPARFSASAAALRFEAEVNARKLVDAVYAAGGEPLTIHPTADVSDLDERLAFVDGVLLPGGGDVTPSLYGGAHHADVYDTDEVQDVFDIAVAGWARRNHRPLLAICRGLQVVNVARGGSLLAHLEEPHRHITTQLNLVGHNRLSALTRQRFMTISCFHHQAIDRLGDGLRATACSRDGVIEAVESDPAEHHWFLGVQWHPEDTAATDPAQQALFDGFVRAASCVAQPNQVCARRFSPSTSR